MLQLRAPYTPPIFVARTSPLARVRVGDDSSFWDSLTEPVPEFVDPDEPPGDDRQPDYYFRGGCTLVVDAETGKVRYSVKKRLNEARRERQRRYLLEEGNESLAATYFGGVGRDTSEPFAMLHRL